MLRSAARSVERRGSRDRQTPYNESSIAPVDSAITTYWSAPLDRASVEQNLVVYSPDGLVRGRFEWTVDSRAFHSSPRLRFATAPGITVSLAGPAHDAAGLPIDLNISFSVGYRNTNSGRADSP